MNKARDNILTRIQVTNLDPKNQVPRFNSPHATKYPDLLAQFTNITKAVGAMVHLQAEGETIEQIIQQYFPEAKSFAGDSEELQLGIINRPLADTAKAHDLQDLDVAIISGSFGVAENGAIWTAQTEKFRALYFIAENLVILLKRDNLVALMHDAYGRVHFSEHGFGVFISGPSKTADIEQSLVIGAHGPGDTLVLLTN